MECDPPDNAKEFEGWTMPAAAHKRSVALKDTQKMFFATPNADRSGIDVSAALRVGLPVPSWMLPLSLVKRVVIELLRETFVRVKERVLDRWHEFDFDARELRSSELYSRVS